MKEVYSVTKRIIIEEQHNFSSEREKKKKETKRNYCWKLFPTQE